MPVQIPAPTSQAPRRDLQCQRFASCSWLLGFEEAFGDLHHHFSLCFLNRSLTASELQLHFKSTRFSR